MVASFVANPNSVDVTASFASLQAAGIVIPETVKDNARQSVEAPGVDIPAEHKTTTWWQ